MSVKALKEALGRLAYSAPDTCDEVSARVVAAAWAELAAIEQAAKDLDRLHIGDFVYSVREYDHIVSAPGESWQHPDVKAWSDAAVLLANIAKEAK